MDSENPPTLLKRLLDYIDKQWVGSDKERAKSVRCGTIHIGNDEEGNGEVVLSLRFPIDNNFYLSPDNILHRLWTRDVGTEGYDKSLWLELEKIVYEGKRVIEQRERQNKDCPLEVL